MWVRWSWCCKYKSESGFHLFWDTFSLCELRVDSDLHSCLFWTADMRCLENACFKWGHRTVQGLESSEAGSGSRKHQKVKRYETPKWPWARQRRWELYLIGVPICSSVLVHWKEESRQRYQKTHLFFDDFSTRQVNLNNFWRSLAYPIIDLKFFCTQRSRKHKPNLLNDKISYFPVPVYLTAVFKGGWNESLLWLKMALYETWVWIKYVAVDRAWWQHCNPSTLKPKAGR